MPSGGHLQLETVEVLVTEDDAGHVAGLAQGAYLQVSVVDDGVGMSREVLARLFEPFFTTKPIGAGTGMGLASVYGTVTAHEGAITVYSELGRGSQKPFLRAALMAALRTALGVA